MSRQKRCNWVHKRLNIGRSSGANKLHRCEDLGTIAVDGWNKYGYQITWVCEDHAAQRPAVKEAI
jgi:hypothetical protein